MGSHPEQAYCGYLLYLRRNSVLFFILDVCELGSGSGVRLNTGAGRVGAVPAAGRHSTGRKPALVDFLRLLGVSNPYRFNVLAD